MVFMTTSTFGLQSLHLKTIKRTIQTFKAYVLNVTKCTKMSQFIPVLVINVMRRIFNFYDNDSDSTFPTSRRDLFT